MGIDELRNLGLTDEQLEGLAQLDNKINGTQISLNPMPIRQNAQSPSLPVDDLPIVEAFGTCDRLALSDMVQAVCHLMKHKYRQPFNRERIRASLLPMVEPCGFIHK